MKIKTLKDFNFKGKKVLVRCDFNVPIQNGKILDDFRIKIALPTIKFLKKEGAKILLISHLGDPGGKRVQELSLAPIVNYLQKLLKSRVKKVNEISDKEIQWEKNEILVLENIRFWEGEEKCDMQFAKLLASFGEIFVNEAFSVAHRKHASVYLLPKLLPACIGFNFEKELKTLETFLRKIKKPLVILIGGKKIETKAPIIKRFLKIADWILVNHPIGEEIKSGNFSFKSSKKIIFPQPTENNLDLDEKTISIFKEKIMKAKTIFWNGPFGKIEDPKFQRGTLEICKAILKSKALSLIGGGETLEFTNSHRLTKKFTLVSSAGGAMLEFLGGKKLPALISLGYYDKQQ